MSDYVQLAGAMVLMVAILIGSYWFVLYAPGRRQRVRAAQRASGPEQR